MPEVFPPALPKEITGVLKVAERKPVNGMEASFVEPHREDTATVRRPFLREIQDLLKRSKRLMDGKENFEGEKQDTVFKINQAIKKLKLFTRVA